MPRYTTTSAALAVATFTGLVAIAQSAISNHSGESAIESTSQALATKAIESAANFSIAPLSRTQRAVLLEGIDWEAPLVLARSGAQR